MGGVALASTVRAQELVLLPAENLSGASEVARLVGVWIDEGIRARGWETLSGEPLEAELAAAGIRRLDSLSTAQRELLAARFGADGYVATTILALRDDGIPLAAAGVRWVDTAGNEMFSEVIGLTAEDAMGILDQRPELPLEGLARRLVDRLLADFPSPGEQPRVSSIRAPRRLRKPPTFRSAALDDVPRPRRVAVLPLADWSLDRDAARITGQLAARWLDRSEDLEPVEPGDLRRALIDERVRDPRQLDPDRLDQVGARVGSTLFLRGTIYRWSRAGPAGAETAPPEVSISLTLIDSTSRRILWTAHHARRGDDYRGLLQRGTITNVVSLTDRVLGEMVAELSRATPVPVPAVTAPLATRLAWVRKGRRP